MPTKEELEKRLAELIQLKEESLSDQRRINLPNLDRDIRQLTNRINNLK